NLHISKGALTLVPGNWPLFVGLSYSDGIAASVIGQIYNREIRILAAFCTEGMSLRQHLVEFTKPWLSANAHRLRIIGGYEDIADVEIRSGIFQAAQEILGGEWASISKRWESRRDNMLDFLVRAIPFTFKPALQFDPVNARPLSQALNSGRFHDKTQTD